MLSEYIKMYIEAQDNNDLKRMDKLERELSSLGVDKYTLDFLAIEMRKEGMRNV